MKLTNSLPNELLIRIFEHLPFEDIQIVRLVCRQWSFVASFGGLNHDLTLRLTPMNCRDVLAKLDEASLIKNRMRNLRLVDMENSTQLGLIFEKACSYVQTMNLINSPIFPSIKHQMINLYELQLDEMPHVAEFNDVADFNLEYFPALKSLLLDRNVACSLRLRLLQLLAMPSTVKLHLENLSFHFSNTEQSLVLNVLGKHASTMKCLELNYFSNKSLNIETWKLLFRQFTKLECLQLSGGYSSVWLQSVFVNLPCTAPLKQLHLRGCIELEDHTLEFIMQKWPNTVRKLNLMLCARITDRSIGYLNLQSNLKELNLSHVRSITGHGLINSIAGYGNFQLRELYLDEINNLDEECFCSLIKHLPNLEHLSVNSCTHAMTDHTVTIIFQNMTKLKSLEFDNCYRISDKGLQGVDGHSIQQLQDLRVLSLRGCPRITDVALIQNFKFDKLRTLKLGYNHRISAKGMAALVRNCSLLKELIITSCSMIKDEAVWHIVTGLKRLRSLNLSNCHNLTQCSIDYIAEHCEELHKLYISGADSLNICEVQQYLRKIKPQIKVL